MQYVERALTPEQAKHVMDALAEGVVEANRAVIDSNPDAFPCCCGCGDFKLVKQRAVPKIAVGRVQGPRALSKSKQGSAFELACFQCAQRRREGDSNAYVDVNVDEQGNLSCVVVREKGEDEDMEKYAPHAACEGDACGCGVS